MVRYEENPVMFVQFCASKTVWLFLSLLLTSFMLIFFMSFYSLWKCYVTCQLGWVDTSLSLFGTRTLYLLTLSSRTLAFIFSTLFYVRLLWHWQAWRIFRLSGASYLGDHFLYSHDLYISIKGDTVRKNGTEPVALRGDGVNVWPLGISDTNSSSHHRKSIYFGPNCLLRRMVWSALRI